MNMKSLQLKMNKENSLNKTYLKLNGSLIGLILRANGLMFGLTQTLTNGNQGNKL